MTATLCFVTKGVHAALRAQMRVGTGLEVVIVTTWRTRCIKVAWRTWCIVAWATVVELTGRALALALRTVVRTWWTITELLCALTIAGWAIPQTITAHMAIGARGTAAFATLAATATTVATTASRLCIANALHHFTACGFGCSGHHVAAWGLA